MHRFGSRVNGTPHEWSDIDLIIVSERFATTRFIRRAYEFKSVVRPHLGMTALCYHARRIRESGQESVRSRMHARKESGLRQKHPLPSIVS